MKVLLSRAKILGRWKSVTLKFTRENVKEWFVVNVSEGMTCPRFYIPVRRKITSCHTEVWIFPLAGFVWLFYVTKNIVWSIVHDAVELEELTRDGLAHRRIK